MKPSTKTHSVGLVSHQTLLESTKQLTSTVIFYRRIKSGHAMFLLDLKYDDYLDTVA